MHPAYQVVHDFEKIIAEFAGSKYACAVDTGTAAIHLACEYNKVRNHRVTIPKRTYVSVPCAIIHAGGLVQFSHEEWSGIYYLNPYPIVDACCRFQRGMYHPGTHWCMSFQYRKHLPIGRGGMILTDDPEAKRWYDLARFSGRHEKPLTEDLPEMIGWQCYMEPERAAKGMTLMMNVPPEGYPDKKFNYPDLSSFNLYENHYAQ